jgi:hypothetical protein
MRDGDGRRMEVSAGPFRFGSWEAAVQLEREGLAAWAVMGDQERHMVQAVVRAALKRLLEHPGWIPGSVRLGDTRLDIFVAIELDETQVGVAAAMEDLDVELAQARLEMAQSLAELADMTGGDDGAPGPATP